MARLKDIIGGSHQMKTPPIASELAPELELSDSTGVVRRLSELVMHGPLVLLFYRGNW